MLLSVWILKYSFIHTLFPPAGDTCNNKHQITNIMTSMSLYIHYVRKREREKKIYMQWRKKSLKNEFNFSKSLHPV